VAVVDLDRLMRAHPRWPDVEQLNRRIADLQAKLSLPPQLAVQVAKIDLTSQMKAQLQQMVAQMRPEFQKQFRQEAEALQHQSEEELRAYQAKVAADKQAEFEAERARLEAEINKAVQDRQQATTREMEQFERQTLEQYRLPLLNLHLKLDAVQQTDKQEADRLNAELLAKTKERDDKIAAHDAESRKALAAFQQQQAEAYKTAVQDLDKKISGEGQALINQKAAELNARYQARLRALNEKLSADLSSQLKADLARRQQLLVAQARQQVGQAQQQAITAAQDQRRELQAQLGDAQAQRARLMDTILAEARVDAATLAQEKGWDLILTRTLGTADTVDATDDLIARMKR